MTKGRFEAAREAIQGAGFREVFDDDAVAVWTAP